ncbi:MAG: hypothetical protein N2554_00970 [Fimbriimonadales bacterium]|nr:hypothetical protein [Fimbriimonadales bacterium]
MVSPDVIVPEALYPRASANLRLPVRKLLGSELPQLHVIAYHEIAPNTNIEIVEQISRAEAVGAAVAVA